MHPINQLPKRTFCFGTQYYRMTPMQQDWARDIERIKELGMDTIRYWALWKWAEPQQGNFFFDDLHQLIPLARQHGLDVLLVIEMDKVPAWLFDAVPDWRLLNLDGKPDVTSHRYVNWDHPEIRRHGERFLREVARQFRQYDGVIYDVWNEPDKPEDAGPVARAKFIAWLQERFASVGALVEKLRLPRFQSWDEVPMPRSVWDTQLYLLYQEFRTWSIAEQVGWAYSIVKEEVPDAPVTVHVHCDEHPFTFRWFENASEVGWDDWEMHRQVDFYIAAKHEFFQGEGTYTRLHNISQAVADFETKRSITGGQYWTTGLGGGATKVWRLHNPVRPKENLFSLWMCAAHEAKGVVYWQYRVDKLLAPEAPGWGLTSFDGGPTYRTREAEEFIAAIRSIEDGLMSASVARPETAVLYSLKSHIINESMPHLSYIHAFEGACLALYINNVTFNVVNERDSLEGLNTILVPQAQCLGADCVARLIRFVEEGGKLIIEAGTGMFDEFGFLHEAIPGGPALSAAAGVREQDTLYEKAFLFETPHGQLSGVQERRLFAMPESAQVLASWEDGTPAAIRNRHGKGEVIYIATNVFQSIRTADIAQTETLLKLAGVKSDISVNPPHAITARVLENERERFIFIFNHTNDNAAAMVDLPFDASTAQIIHRGEVDFSFAPRAIDVAMAAREVLVLRVTK